jgi:hypothetical protein
VGDRREPPLGELPGDLPLERDEPRVVPPAEGCLQLALHLLVEAGEGLVGFDGAPLAELPDPGVDRGLQLHQRPVTPRR